MWEDGKLRMMLARDLWPNEQGVEIAGQKVVGLEFVPVIDDSGDNKGRVELLVWKPE